MDKELQGAKIIKAIAEGIDVLLEPHIGHNYRVSQIRLTLREGAAWLGNEIEKMEAERDVDID